MKYLKLLIAVTNFAAIVMLIKENSSLRARLSELTDKYWEGNMQIALYDDCNLCTMGASRTMR